MSTYYIHFWGFFSLLDSLGKGVEREREGMTRSKGLQVWIETPATAKDSAYIGAHTLTGELEERSPQGVHILLALYCTFNIFIRNCMLCIYVCEIEKQRLARIQSIKNKLKNTWEKDYKRTEHPESQPFGPFPTKLLPPSPVTSQKFTLCPLKASLVRIYTKALNKLYLDKLLSPPADKCDSVCSTSSS